MPILLPNKDVKTMSSANTMFMASSSASVILFLIRLSGLGGGKATRGTTRATTGTGGATRGTSSSEVTPSNGTYSESELDDLDRELDDVDALDDIDELDDLDARDDLDDLDRSDDLDELDRSDALDDGLDEPDNLNLTDVGAGEMASCMAGVSSMMAGFSIFVVLWLAPLLKQNKTRVYSRSLKKNCNYI
ncbi:hypothetical protein DPMN_084937 [Dreissena polymorpha]|uniref:Uncharacterized protein n=1 Tax=Dreissena polymorpha TaxID=45954 RepID=A0A9D3YER5_DREPO|nr:hypothetical protein DPMN_084937 [Dreissena polymorpha]